MTRAARAEPASAIGHGTALARIVLAGACWGLAAVIAKQGFDRGVPPVRMAQARVAVALAALLAILVAGRRELMRPPPGSLPLLASFGAAVVGVNGAYYVAIDRLPVGVALSLQYTAPVLLLAVAAAAGARRPGHPAWLAGALTLAGAVLVSRGYEGFRGADGTGLVAGAVSAVFFALYLLGADAAGRRGAHPVTLLFWGFLAAFAIWSIALPWWTWPWAALADPRAVLAVLGAGLLGTLLPFFLVVTAIPVLSPATAGIAATVEPPFAAAFAWVFLSERLAAIQMLGGVLVLAGVAIAHRARPLAEDALAAESAP